MMRFWLMSSGLMLLIAAAIANPANIIRSGSDGIVEIEKQKLVKLVKFPEDGDQRERQQTTTDPLIKQKEDEAKRILEEIEKINQSLGYVKKQPEPSKVPPILDSSQYLFPKPAYQPFHAHNHQISGSNGEILLVPSIRAVKLDRSFQRPAQATASKLISYNVPPLRNAIDDTPHTPSIRDHPTNSSRSQQQSSPELQEKIQYFYRPNQVHLPAPQNAHEQHQLPTHFVIPVRLYKLNKEEYIKQFAPQEYRVKGYKIVGDIDNFYGKVKKPTKNQNKNASKSSSSKKSSPKYHLFFLPRELALNMNTNLKKSQSDQIRPSIMSTLTSQETGTRVEKLANRPFKIQTSATATGNNVTSSSQIVRKRIIPKPLRNKETNINSLATQQLADGSSATTATTIHITPPPPPSQPAAVSAPASALATTSLPSSQSNQFNNGIINVPPVLNSNKNTYNLLNNRPPLNFLMSNLRPLSGNTNGNINNNNNMNFNSANSTAMQQNATAANAIKMAFQNIFKFPFRQDHKPEASQSIAASSSPNLESVPLQTPQKTFFGAQALMPHSFYNTESIASAQLPHQISSLNSDKDYKWDEDEGGSSGADESDNGSPEADEKQFFGGHHHKHQQDTQKEALKQGGIIIQRLKVRKGGIAIAGPGGVATAGSGGTAIVGPGGYALTHPRSLTIAGPGAKVIAIPADVDLKDALQRTNLHSKSFPREGKVVATGPTVYYSPATGTATEP